MEKQEEYRYLENTKLVVDLKYLKEVLKDYKIDVTEFAEIITKYRKLANNK